MVRVLKPVAASPSSAGLFCVRALRSPRPPPPPHARPSFVVASNTLLASVDGVPALAGSCETRPPTMRADAARRSSSVSRNSVLTPKNNQTEVTPHKIVQDKPIMTMRRIRKVIVPLLQAGNRFRGQSRQFPLPICAASGGKEHRLRCSQRFLQNHTGCPLPARSLKRVWGEPARPAAARALAATIQPCPHQESLRGSQSQSIE